MYFFLCMVAFELIKIFQDFMIAIIARLISLVNSGIYCMIRRVTISKTKLVFEKKTIYIQIMIQFASPLQRGVQEKREVVFGNYVQVPC